MADITVLDEQEAAQRLHLSVDQLKEYVDQGLLDAYRLPGGILRFAVAHLQAFLDQFDTRKSRMQTLGGGAAERGTSTRVTTAGLLDEIKEFVQAVMHSEGIQPSPHVTEEVLTAVGVSTDRWLPQYKELLHGRKKATVHQLIGRAAAELTGQEATGLRPRSRSGIAKNYTVLRPQADR